MTRRGTLIVAALLLIVLVASLMSMSMTMAQPALAAEPHHHEGESAAVDAFYSSWYKPDNPAASCCNKIDCYSTEIKYRGATLLARQRENGAWIVVPPAKIERNRDSPDGRNHVCMSKEGTVFCFSLGTGG